jgi:hypothetical protein
MRIAKNKASFIAVLLLLTTITSVLLVPSLDAHTPPFQIPTFAFCNVAPNPCGIGQTVTIAIWLNVPPPTANGPYGDRWTGMTVKITKPDGTAETLGPFTSDDTGGTFTTYTPTTVGNYTFEMNYPGQTIAGNNLSPTVSSTVKAYTGDKVLPSNSNVYTLAVQQEPVPSVPLTPLPSNYWETPVNAENVNYWYSISGNWLGLGAFFSANTGMYNQNGNYNPYTTAPKTAHIVWTKPAAFGGALGGEFGGDLTSNYYSTRQYEKMFAPIIINGVLYYTMYPGSSTSPTGWAAVDLFTGKTLWTTNTPLTAPATTFSLGNGTTLSVANGDFNVASTQGAPTVLRCGQLLDYVSPNQYGGLAYLWSTGTPNNVAAATNIAPGTTTWNMFDAMTGSYILSIVNGSALWALTQDTHGNLIGYFVNTTNPNAPTLNMWNSTQCIPISAAGWQWRPPQGAILPFQTGIMWSKPIATNISGISLPPLQSSRYSCFGLDSGVVLLTWMDASGLDTPTTYTIEAGYSADTGQQLWITNRTQTPFARLDTPGASIWMGSGVYVEATLPTNTLVGYSVTTGEKLWTTVLPDANPYDSIGQYESGQVANGTLYTWGLGGDIWAVNILNGKVLWHTNTVTLHGEAGTNTPYGVWPLWTFTTGTIADGILFLPEGHEYSPPLFHGAQQLAINITNGELVWKVLAFGTTNPPAIADGIMLTLNAYDNQIYAFGRGPTKTTVSAPAVGITTTTSIVISGAVTDISSGASQDAVANNFPNGLPCVSDKSMSPFMEAVYEQQQMPNNITGVPVTISVLDSNGNYRTIGQTTTDSLGNYGFTWTPDISGDYTVYASFTGTESYYASKATVTLHASEPAATPTSAIPAPSMADLYFVPGIIAVIVAIVVIGAVTILALKKKP